MVPPKKKPWNGVLNPADKCQGEELPRDLFIVEKRYGRKTHFWKIISVRFVWDESRYDIISAIFCALIILHIYPFLLKAEDSDEYQNYLKQLFKVGTLGKKSSPSRNNC